jgi:hypothetical protein
MKTARSYTEKTSFISTVLGPRDSLTLTQQHPRLQLRGMAMDRKETPAE